MNPLTAANSSTAHRGLAGTSAPKPGQVFLAGGWTRYWTYGSEHPGPVIVAVHGFRGDHHGLEPLIAALGSYRVIVPDLPGFGKSEPFPATQHTVEAYAAWLADFVAVAAAGAEVVLLGHSFGSVIVADALARGLKATHGVLVNPIGAPALQGRRSLMSRLAVLYYRLGAKLPEQLGLALLRSPLVVRLTTRLMVTTKQRPLRRWISAQHLRYFSVFADRRVVLEAFESSVQSDVTDYAQQVRPRMLLVGGDRDDITPAAAQQRLAAMFPAAELVMLPNVGHLIHYEAPGQAAQAIRRFLAGADQ